MNYIYILLSYLLSDNWGLCEVLQFIKTYKSLKNQNVDVINVW